MFRPEAAPNIRKDSAPDGSAGRGLDPTKVGPWSWVPASGVVLIGLFSLLEWATSSVPGEAMRVPMAPATAFVLVLLGGSIAVGKRWPALRYGKPAFMAVAIVSLLWALVVLAQFLVGEQADLARFAADSGLALDPTGGTSALTAAFLGCAALATMVTLAPVKTASCWDTCCSRRRRSRARRASPRPATAR